MKAVILCGGQGTRFREVTEILPKPLAPIGDRPLLWHIMKLYAHFGITDFVLCLGYKAWKIKEFFLNYRAITCDCSLTLGNPASVEFRQSGEENDWHVTLVETGNDTMTGARLWKARTYLEHEAEFCLTYGDGLADIEIPKLLAAHHAHGTAGTVTGVCPTGRYGELSLDGTLVTRFEEKPGMEVGWVNGGFMVFDSARFWPYLSAAPELVLETDVLPAMARDRQLSVYKHEGFWVGVDTAREHAQLNDLWDRGTAPWRLWSVPRI